MGDKLIITLVIITSQPITGHIMNLLCGLLTRRMWSIINKGPILPLKHKRPQAGLGYLEGENMIYQNLLINWEKYEPILGFQSARNINTIKRLTKLRGRHL